MYSFESDQAPYGVDVLGLKDDEPESVRLRRLHPNGRFHNLELAEIALLMGRDDLPVQNISKFEWHEFQKRYNNPEDKTVVGDIVERRLRSIYHSAAYWYALARRHEDGQPVKWDNFEDFFQASVLGVFENLDKQRGMSNFMLKPKMELLIQKATKREARRFFGRIEPGVLADDEDLSVLTEDALISTSTEQEVLSRISLRGLLVLMSKTPFAEHEFLGPRNIAITLASAIEGRTQDEIASSLEKPITRERVRQIVEKILNDTWKGLRSEHMTRDILTIDGITSKEIAVLERLRDQFKALGLLRQQNSCTHESKDHKDEIRRLREKIEVLEARIKIDKKHPLHPQHLIDDAQPEVFATIKRDPYWDLVWYGRLPQADL